MPDSPELEPVTKAEPVAVADIAKLAIVVAAYFGLEVPDDTATKVVAGVVALVLFVQTTWFARNRVTPVQRAEANEKDAYKQGLAVGDAIADKEAPQATVVQVDGNPDVDRILAGLKRLAADIDRTDIDPVAPPPPPPDPIPWAPTRLPPPPGLD